MWKTIKRGLALFLSLLTVLQYPLEARAQEEELSNTYIRSVSIGTAEDLIANGYTVVYDDLNAGGTSLYLGYQFTNDPTEAITGVSALGMYGGYSELSYRDQLLNDSDGVRELGTQLQTAASAFQTQYNAGSPYAQIAYDTLNALMVPAELQSTAAGTPLGDYLLSPSRTLTDFKRLGLMCSTTVITYILNQLCFGVADDLTASDGTSWILRLVQNGPLPFDESLDQGEIEAIYKEEYDSLYMQRGHKLYAAVSAFAADYLEASSRSGSLGELNLPEEATAQTAVDDALTAFSEGSTLEFDEEAEDAAELSDAEYGDLLPLGLYELLDQRDEAGQPRYPFGTNEDGTVRSLAEFFIAVGTMEETEEAYRQLYPLIVEQNGVTPLTAGQETMLYLSGLSHFISLGFSDEDALDKARSSSAEQVNELLATNDGKQLSVWYDINTELYDEAVEGVYWTSSLTREAAAHNRYDLLTKPVGSQSLSLQKELNNALIYTGCVAIAALGAVMVATTLLKTFAAVKGTAAMVSCAIMYLTGHTIAYSAAACVACVLGTVCLVIAVLAIVAIVVIALIKLFKWLLEDDEPDLELTEIPKLIYDYNSSGEGSAVSYQVVTAPGTDTAANLNAGLKNTPWVALYITRDTSVGEPITGELSGNNVTLEPFTVQYGSQTVPEGYSALRFFESTTAANLNEYRDGATGVFCFLHRLGDTVPVEEQEGIYLMEVLLASEDTEEAAKAKLIDRGYHVIDYNLTSDGSIDTYLGYLTTDNEADAITDLRVAYATGQNVNGATITYGGAQYGCCGNAGNLLLMESKWACAGSPVLADSLIVTTTLGNAPAGYEPVNLFCGGPAFDFNNCNNWEMTSDKDGKEGSSKWSSHTFVYFHPSETFTSGTQYLGGLAFFSGEVSSYMAELGWTQLTNANLSGASDENITYDLSGVQDGTTVLCYSMTYNPYRAIYDIQAYDCEASGQGLAYNLTLSSGGAAACDVFQQGGGGVGKNRLVRYSHAYRSNGWYEGGSYYEPSGYVDQIGIYDTFDKYDGYTAWYLVDDTPTACNLCCSGLYVVGNTCTTITQANPICLSELLVSASSEYDPEKLTPIRSITDCYAESGANLAFQDLYHSGSMYLYLRRADPYAVRPAYVASVTVAYVKGKDLDKNAGSIAPYDSAVYSLVSNGAGQLLAVDLTGGTAWQDHTMTYRHEYISDVGTMERIKYQQVSCISHETDYAVALLWVTYTKAKTSALCDLVFYDSADGSIPDTLSTADGSVTVACGQGFQENGVGSYYFLRAVYNAGNPITDLVVDDNVMLRGYWTSLSTAGTVSAYDTYYIKAKHLQKATLTYYISGIYSATGSTEREAQLALLNQGCRYFCPFNLNPGGPDAVYLGYTLTTSYKKAYSGLILYDAGQDNSVDTIIKGRDTYIRVTDSLNSGVYDAIICMYLTNSVRKACENGAAKAKDGHYITDLVFFTGTDLNDYATGEKSLDTLDAETRAYVESYIYDADGDPIYWDIVTDNTGKIVNSNLKVISGDKLFFPIQRLSSGQYYTYAPEVYMYVHYSDNGTPNLDNLSGSVFTNHPIAAVTVLAGGGLILLAAVYLLLRKRQTTEGAN